MKPLVYKKSRTRPDAREPERHKMHIAKGDTVRVISGEHRGKEGKVLRVFPKEFRVEVEGVNVVKKHKRAANPNQERHHRADGADRGVEGHAARPQVRGSHAGPAARGQGRHGAADRGQVGPADSARESEIAHGGHEREGTDAGPAGWPGGSTPGPGAEGCRRGSGGGPG